MWLRRWRGEAGLWLSGRTSRIFRQEFPELKKWCKKVSGHQAAIMEVLGMAGKLLRNISPDKIENRDAEYYKQALDLSPGYSDCEMAWFMLVLSMRFQSRLFLLVLKKKLLIPTITGFKCPSMLHFSAFCAS